MEIRPGRQSFGWFHPDPSGVVCEHPVSKGRRHALHRFEHGSATWGVRQRRAELTVGYVDWTDLVGTPLEQDASRPPLEGRPLGRAAGPGHGGTADVVAYARERAVPVKVV